jgi:hypothetical protein
MIAPMMVHPLTPTANVRQAIKEAAIYKMSLGRDGSYREQALHDDVMIYSENVEFYDAVISGDTHAIEKAGAAIRHVDYPNGGAPPSSWRSWKQTIDAFLSMPTGSLVLHWYPGFNELCWGLSASDFTKDEVFNADVGQKSYVFRRKLQDGWRNKSIGETLLKEIHPRARSFVVNPATLSLVRENQDYFRALILDEDRSTWEDMSDWVEAAVKARWQPKNRASLPKVPKKMVPPSQPFEAATSPPVPTSQSAPSPQPSPPNPIAIEIADHFEAEIRRMANTALQTAAYANGQTIMVTVKNKDGGFTRDELVREIGDLLEKAGYRCALTGYDFRKKSKNPHLLPSLDRKDSRLGYVQGNLQVVTRAANFYKSASDEADWALKAKAMMQMALAIQKQKQEGA